MAPVRIVTIHDGARLRPESREQPKLGLKVLFHVGMKIQMILRKIGEHRRLKQTPRGPIERKRMGGYFHHRGIPTGIDHLPEETL